MPLAKNPVKPKTRRVVHLGNANDVGVTRGLKGMVMAEHGVKTGKYAKRFPNVEFIGIDLTKFPAREKNWKQVEADFLIGLKRLRNGSVDIISSEMAFGYYGKTASGYYGKKPPERKEHTAEVAKEAFRKLRENGKLMVAVDSEALKLVVNSLAKAGFEKNKIKVRELAENEKKRTYELKTWGLSKLYQVIAQK
ncbi:MAG: hypothetical protein WC602_01025 [archaeon]